jgi:hypothetical protein
MNKSAPRVGAIRPRSVRGGTGREEPGLAPSSDPSALCPRGRGRSALRQSSRCAISSSRSMRRGSGHRSPAGRPRSRTRSSSEEDGHAHRTHEFDRTPRPGHTDRSRNRAACA